MSTSRTVSRVLALCALVALAVSCAGAPAAVTSPAPTLDPADAAAVKAAVAWRAAAIAVGDKEGFMSLLAPGDGESLLEQSRWFDYRLTAEISGYGLEVLSLRPVGKDACEAALRLRYRIGSPGEERALDYLQLYRRIDGTWLDADLVFDLLESTHFLIKFERGIDRQRVWRIQADAERAWELVEDSWGEAPAAVTTLKIFADRELLRQNSKITVSRLFSGWGEPGESIKLWLRPDPAYSYTPLLAHELVHKVSLSTSRNLCSWLAEGIANCFGFFPAMGGTYLDTGYHQASDYDRSLAFLASVDPDAVTTDAEWALYGGMAGMVLRFIVESHGEGKPQELVRALAAYPAIEGGYSFSRHDAAYRAQLADCLPAVLGVDLDGLDAAWRAWIARLGG